MVRIKHRYLLLHILHPNPTTSTTNKTTNSSKEQAPPIPWGPLTFHRPTPDKLLTPPLLLKLIKDSLSTLFGELASGQIASSLQIKYCSAATSTAIVRVARANYRMVWAALSFVTRLSPLPPLSVTKPPGGMMEEEGVVVVRVVRVSGTVKKCEEEAVRR
ncbi:RNase_P_Rpp14-domain-containing protein, partial [Sphaerulina musiva SO2202]